MCNSFRPSVTLQTSESVKFVIESTTSIESIGTGESGSGFVRGQQSITKTWPERLAFGSGFRFRNVKTISSVVVVHFRIV